MFHTYSPPSSPVSKTTPDQEHLESDNPLYHDAVAATQRILNRLTRHQLQRIAAEETALMFSRLSEKREWSIAYLRTFFLPVFTRMFFKVVFDELCPPDIETLIVESADNIISALKVTSPLA